VAVQEVAVVEEERGRGRERGLRVPIREERSCLERVEERRRVAFCIFRLHVLIGSDYTA
jgi:hypothetical protein